MSDTSPDLPRVAVVLNRDLMFGSRIRGAVAALGLEARFARDTDAFLAAVVDLREVGAIGIIDMNSPVSWEALSATLARHNDLPPLLAFGPHVDVENRRAAKAAGVARIVSNGQFHTDMQALIDRYRRK